VEDPNLYQPGGFHPVKIGDRLGVHRELRVVLKLGFGGYATVWLCEDALEKKWRALKIIAAHASNRRSCPELQAIEFLGQFDRSVLDAHHIGSPIRHFTHEGPNGRHLCVVLPFLGPSIDIAQAYAMAVEYALPRLGS
ncbi:hypothetical protein B0T17DRAFT_501288, partial [Bombardia bombarda]